MNIFDAEAQSRTFVRVRVPIFVFGLLIFMQGLFEPLNESAHYVISWAKILPLAVAVYIGFYDKHPSMFDKQLDEYTQQSEMTARTNAGIAGLAFLILTLAFEQVGLWSYANAVDCVIGVYLMFYSGTILHKMRDN